MGAKYLNVDLEVRSRADLLALKEQLGSAIDLMFYGETDPGNFLLSVEAQGSGLLGSNPDGTANALCELVERLEGSARELWDSADDRVFDVGFEGVSDSRIAEPLLSPATLMRIGRLNARVAISVYTNNAST